MNHLSSAFKLHLLTNFDILIIWSLFCQSAVKEEKREARKAKKELKELYKFETQKAQKVAAITGPSSIRLM